MYFYELLGGGNRVYLTLLDLPIKEYIRLQPGDIIKIYKALENYDVRDRVELLENTSYTTVTEPIASLPSYIMLIYISRRQNKERSTFYRWEGLKPIRVKQ